MENVKLVQHLKPGGSLHKNQVHEVHTWLNKTAPLQMLDNTNYKHEVISGLVNIQKVANNNQIAIERDRQQGANVHVGIAGSHPGPAAAELAALSGRRGLQAAAPEASTAAASRRGRSANPAGNSGAARARPPANRRASSGGGGAPSSAAGAPPRARGRAATAADASAMDVDVGGGEPTAVFRTVSAGHAAQPAASGGSDSNADLLGDVAHEPNASEDMSCMSVQRGKL